MIKSTWKQRTIVGYGLRWRADPVSSTFLSNVGTRIVGTRIVLQLWLSCLAKNQSDSITGFTEQHIFYKNKVGVKI